MLELKKLSNTKKIVITAMFAALVTVATLVQVPIPGGYGYVNLGDTFVLLAAFLMGPLFGACASGIGAALGDLILGSPIYMPATFVIKAGMAVAAYFIYAGMYKACKKLLPSEIVAAIVAELIMVAGYFLYEPIIWQSWEIALAGVPFNLIQGAIGAFAAVVILNVLFGAKAFASPAARKEEKDEVNAETAEKEEKEEKDDKNE